MKKAKTESQKIEKKQSSDIQFLWLVLIFVGIILAFIVTPIIYQKTVNEFTYGGIQFEKIKEGKITFYHGVFPIIYQDQLSSLHNIYFRTDPRKNNISINVDDLSLSGKISISLSPGVEECKSLVLANPQLANFLQSFPFVETLNSGVSDAEMAKALNVSLITCQNASNDSSVIIIQKSDTPSIERGDRDGCHILNVGDCQYLETIERYTMAIIAQVNNASIKL
jgi:hypothetical protein